MRYLFFISSRISGSLNNSYGYKRYGTFFYCLACFLTSMLLFFSGGNVYAKELNLYNKDCFTTFWPHEKSDLKPDPAMFFGRLDNGLRYVIMENKEPRDRVGLYLNIQAGSLKETEDQRGLAHFLEHMLFNGTTNFPPGTLVEYFQSIGMSFGADSNAHTNYDETVYNLMLPNGEKKTVNDGLLVLNDYARGALLLEDEVERERGVILAEKRTRNSARFQIHKKGTEFSFAGTKVATRLPIGTEEILLAADSTRLRQYYDTWYHPENMVLVIVGDIKIELAQELVKKKFASLEGKMLDKKCASPGLLDHSGTKVQYLSEPELGYANVTIETMWNTLPHADTAAWEKDRLLEYLGIIMMNNRLKRIVSEPDSPFTRASMYSGIFLQYYGYASASAKLKSGDWRNALEVLSNSVRLAYEKGFTAMEFERAKKELQGQLEKEVQTVAGRSSKGLAYQIIGKLNNNEVILSPQQEYDFYTPMLEAMTIEQVNKAFENLWGNDTRLIEITGDIEIDKDQSLAEKMIKDVFQKSLDKELKSYQVSEKITFPYLTLSDSYNGKVIKDDFKHLGAARYTFQNGTVLNVKKTDFKPNEIMVAVHFGGGRLSEPAPGLAKLAQSVIRESGVGEIPRDDLAAALAGKNVRVIFSASRESFSISGQGLSSELELLFQLIYTYLNDPAFRPEAYELSMERFKQVYQQLESSVDGIMPLVGERFLAGGDLRYGVVPYEQFSNLKLEQVEKWLKPILASEPLEISIVGDFKEKEVENLTAKYFGTQPRHSLKWGKGKKIDFPHGAKLYKQVDSEIDKGVFTLAWLTDDFWDITRTRRFNVLAAVLSDRLRREIREEMGEVYSAYAYNRSSRVDPGYGVLKAEMIVDPKMIDTVAQQVRQVAATFAAHGVDQKELKLITGPIQTSIKDMMRTNGYWLDSVLTLSSRYPQQLQWPLSLKNDFTTISAEEISALAKEYLLDVRAAQIISVPSHKKTEKSGL